VLRTFQTVSEDVFSETHLQVIERLCTQASKTPRFSPYRHTTLPQDVVGLDGYAELSARSRSARGTGLGDREAAEEYYR
jgi:hypothetical protein